MTEVQVTCKGQITIPVELRRKFNIEEGGRVQVVEEGGKIVVRKALSFYDLAGSGASEANVDEVKAMLDDMRGEDEG